MQRTAVHELLHVLGFSSARFASFYDVAAQQTRSNVVVSGTGPSGKPVTLLNLPTVKAKLAEHLGQGCAPSAFAGVELEESGGSGSASSHWESRFAVDEIMAPSASEGSGAYLTALTLALLKDSGW